MSITSGEIKRFRRETPACESILHFNNAGASLMPEPAIQVQRRYLELEQEIGGYEAAAARSRDINGFYKAIAALIGAQPDEIAYVDSATRAWHQAIHALPLKPGDRILTHITEYEANYLTFLALKSQKGIEIDFAASDETGQIDIADMARKITPRTRLISVSHIPTFNGVINPAAEIGKLAKEAGILYLLDACQSVGQMDINVGDIGCDMLCATGRKYMRGPRGTGFLYVAGRSLNRLTPHVADSHSARLTGPSEWMFTDGAKRFEIYERSVAAMLGLAESARYASDIGPARIRDRIDALATVLRSELTLIKGVSVHDWGARKCGIVTFTKEGHKPTDLMLSLRARGINISVSTSTQIDPNGPVIAAPHLARASVHYFNTKREISTFCEAIAAL